MKQTKYGGLFSPKTTIKIRSIGPRDLHRLNCGNGTNRTILFAWLRRPDQNNQKETLKLSLLAASSACLLALGISACGPSKEEIALAKAESATGQACEDSEAAIKLAGQGYEEGLDNVISLKAELLDNIQGDNPTDWREKYSNFSSLLVDVRQDFVINYGDLREKYGNKCTNDTRRAEFDKTYVTPFNKRLVELANKLHS